MMLYEEMPFDEIDLYSNGLEQDMEQSEVDWDTYLFGILSDEEIEFLNEIE